METGTLKSVGEGFAITCRFVSLQENVVVKDLKTPVEVRFL